MKVEREHCDQLFGQPEFQKQAAMRSMAVVQQINLLISASLDCGAAGVPGAAGGGGAVALVDPKAASTVPLIF